jgi:hypothetical protein
LPGFGQYFISTHLSKYAFNSNLLAYLCSQALFTLALFICIFCFSLSPCQWFVSFIGLLKELAVYLISSVGFCFLIYLDLLLSFTFSFYCPLGFLGVFFFSPILNQLLKAFFFFFLITKPFKLCLFSNERSERWTHWENTAAKRDSRKGNIKTSLCGDLAMHVQCQFSRQFHNVPHLFWTLVSGGC